MSLSSTSSLAAWVLEPAQAQALPAETLILDCSSQAQYEAGHWPGPFGCRRSFCSVAPGLCRARRRS